MLTEFKFDIDNKVLLLFIICHYTEIEILRCLSKGGRLLISHSVCLWAHVFISLLDIPFSVKMLDCEACFILELLFYFYV